jgi:hypothetical protein
VMRSPCGSFSTSQSRLVSAIASAETSHIATLQPSADQLARELAAHARAAPGDNSDLSGKILHGRSLTFPLQYCEILAGARIEPPTRFPSDTKKASF